MAVRTAAAVLILLFAASGVPGAAEPGSAFIPAGEFMRGRTFDWPDGNTAWSPIWFKDDLPARKIRLEAFYLDETEVTNEHYAAFVKATGRRAPYHWKKGAMPEGKPKHPVINVDWADASAFCAWDGSKRLPTEAEWERAARGLAEGRMFPWGDEDPTPKRARFGATNGPQPVCGAERNSFGLCDMIGNVWEWTADWYDRGYYVAAPDRDPRGPASGMYRVIRGGSWFDDPKPFLTVSYRSWARPAERSQTIGFRCARSFGATAAPTKAPPGVLQSPR